MPTSLTGKTAIVTGSANGTGLAIARHFVAEGANVMFADMDEDRLQAEVGADARAEKSIRLFAGDLRHKLTIANLLAATAEAFDRVDILVNASRQIALSDPLSVENDGVEALLQQNLITSLRMTQMTAKRMIAQARQTAATGSAGSIISLSSIAAIRTQAPLLAWSIACAALDQMTRSMAVALAPHHIRINAVAFGSVMSASLQNSLKDHPDYLQDITAHTPMGRIAAASELAGTVQFLASDASAFMTGQVLTLDGGRSLIDPVNAPAH